MEFVAVVIAAFGGGVGILGETWNQRRRRLTKTGWVALSFIVAAAVVALVQATENYFEEKQRKALQANLSYKAMISIYGPLSMWLDDFNVLGVNENNQDYVYPPILNLDIYETVRSHDDVLRALPDILAEGVRTSSGTFKNDRAEAFADRYRLIQNQIDTAIVSYGPHVTMETLIHLQYLKTHSLFRDAPEFQTRGEDGNCRGWIDQLAMEMTNGELETKWKIRCKQMMGVLLKRALRDPLLDPPFDPAWEELHREHCELIGYRKPYCGWSDERSTAGLSID